MTEKEYLEALAYIKEHMDIEYDDPMFMYFKRLVAEVEEYEEEHFSF